jgi:ribose-phosphate pyrophosphokinase
MTSVNPNIRPLQIFTGNSNKDLANEIVKSIGGNGGYKNFNLGSMTVGRFADGEVNVKAHDNIRGNDVYIIQSTCTPVNENLMELLLMISTIRRSSARRITAVIPYYGYARQDRKLMARVPISAADVAVLIESMGADRVIAVDLHCGQIQGFFSPRVPVDNLNGSVVGVNYFLELGLKNLVIVSPDAGGVQRAEKFRELLAKSSVDASFAMISKQRKEAGKIARMDLVGSVDGLVAVIVDDIVDTAGTLTKAANELKKFGAVKVYAFITHGIFSEPASQRITDSDLEEVVVTDTIPLNEYVKNNPKIKVVSVGSLLAEAITRIHENRSISELFRVDNE